MEFQLTAEQKLIQQTAHMTVQNSLVNWPLTTFGTDEQKRRYLPRLATGEILGCYALTAPVGCRTTVARTATHGTAK